MTPEDMVEIYQKELLNRQMIEVTKRRKDGRAKRCCIRGELHDIILSKVKDIGLFHIHGNTSDRETDASSKLAVRRVAEHGDIKDYPCKKSLYICALTFPSTFKKAIRLQRQLATFSIKSFVIEPLECSRCLI
ncbi:hypothetical protein FH972_014103 [Carpinus fangiana]|uniref:Uncharacterized protein n=1 Tax=Carpinus fangiana TaxID=176857 RepID=A0A5N6RC85_9ROSI|nr:hypothetical protein FH972_014103 [Carpinus fangiana]